MSLKDRLHQLGPDGDAYLADVWKAFKDTEAHEALAIEVQAIECQARADVNDPKSSSELRAHAAGRLFALEALDRSIHFAFNWTPPPVEAREVDEESDEGKDVPY